MKRCAICYNEATEKAIGSCQLSFIPFRNFGFSAKRKKKAEEEEQKEGGIEERDQYGGGSDVVHLVCAASIKDICIRKVITSSSAEAASELTSRAVAPLNSLEYQQQICEACGEIDADIYLKCADSLCGNYSHLKCTLFKHTENVIVRRKDGLSIVEILCAVHRNTDHGNFTTPTSIHMLEAQVKSVVDEMACSEGCLASSEEEVGEQEEGEEEEALAEVSSKQTAAAHRVTKSSSESEIHQTHYETMEEEGGGEMLNKEYCPSIEIDKERRGEQQNGWQTSTRKRSKKEEMEKGGILFQPQLGETAIEVEEEEDGNMRRHKMKFSACGVPIFPLTNDNNRLSLLVEWWRCVSESYFRQVSVKETNCLFVQNEKDHSDRVSRGVSRGSMYSSLLDKEMFTMGDIPTFKNNSLLTVVYEAAAPAAATVFSPVDVFSSETTASAVVAAVLMKFECEYSDVLEGVSSISNNSSRSSSSSSSSSSSNNLNARQLANHLNLVDFQLLDSHSLDCSKACNKAVQDSVRSGISGGNGSVESSAGESSSATAVEQGECSQLDQEITFFSKQLIEFHSSNEQNCRGLTEKVRDAERIQGGGIGGGNCYDNEILVRSLQDQLKYRTVLRYFKIGYGEKDLKVLSTYMKNDESEGNSTAATTTTTKNSSEQKQLMCLRNSEGYMEIDCKICLNNHNSENNPVVYCSSCSASFHQLCYGIKTIPNDDFFCDLCRHRAAMRANLNITEKKAGKKEHGDLCGICGKKGFPMKFVLRGFYHVSCLFFLNLLNVTDGRLCLRNDTLTAMDLSSVVIHNELSLHTSCFVCQKRFGFKIQCAQESCRLAAHTLCAYIAGVQFEVDIVEVTTAAGNGSQADLKPSIYCLEHSNAKNRSLSLQVYLRRYGINLYKTATAFNDFSHFASTFHEEERQSLEKTVAARKKMDEIDLELTAEDESDMWLKSFDVPENMMDIETSSVKSELDFLPVKNEPQRQVKPQSQQTLYQVAPAAVTSNVLKGMDENIQLKTKRKVDRPANTQLPLSSTSTGRLLSASASNLLSKQQTTASQQSSSQSRNAQIKSTQQQQLAAVKKAKQIDSIIAEVFSD